jgi:hypothetical protein
MLSPHGFSASYTSVYCGLHVTSTAQHSLKQRSYQPAFARLSQPAPSMAPTLTAAVDDKGVLRQPPRAGGGVHDSVMQEDDVCDARRHEAVV